MSDNFHLTVGKSFDSLREKDKRANSWNRCEKNLRKFLRSNLHVLKGSITQAGEVNNIFKVPLECVDTRSRQERMSDIVEKELGIRWYHHGSAHAFDNGNIYYHP